MMAVEQIPRLTVGTVQFGKPYGVANVSGQPDFPLVLEIVEAALENGVGAFDTAAIYGSSEEVLGRALRELGATGTAFVVTKVRHLTPEERANPSLASAAVRESVEASCEKLGMDRLPLVLMHMEEDAVALDALMEQIDRGLVGHAGVSCGNIPDVALRLIDDVRVEALQIPCNLLDPRFVRANVPSLAAAKGIGIFVRSVYLQGLIVMPEERVPEFLRSVIPVRQQLEAIAREQGLTIAELAMRYILSLHGVSSVLAGVETRAQLLENIDLVARGPLADHVMDKISATVPDLPELLITPAMWTPFQNTSS
jgi:aryl-alcohol dehydrogenase-like predicted oxidoreductase